MYALYDAPQALCKVVLAYPGLEKQVRRGADLFLPGVVRPADLEDVCIATNKRWPEVVFQGPVVKGQVVCVASAERPWAPYAVGRMHRSSTDFLSTGLNGIAVEVLHTEGDFLWAMGSKKPAPSSPPAALISAIEEAKDAEAAREEARAARAAESARLAVEARIVEIPRLRRKAEKSLRQIADLKSKGAVMDAAQAEKLSKEGALVAELKALDRELAELQCDSTEGAHLGECAAFVDESGASVADGNENGDGEGKAIEPGEFSVAENAGNENTSTGEDDSGESNNGDGRGTGIVEGSGNASGKVEVTAATEGGNAEISDESEVAESSDLFSEIDALFLSSLLAELKLASPSSKAPLLVSTLFGKASLRAGGVGVKKTTWKTSAAILDSLPEGTITTRSTGGKAAVLEVVGFDQSLAPAFTVVESSASSNLEECLATATKKGPEVVVSERMVKNHRVTFVDGLEGWGFDKARLELLAGELRRLFGVSAAVGVRSGTEDNVSKGRKELWSLKLGGMISEKVKDALVARGVKDVRLPTKKKGQRKK